LPTPRGVARKDVRSALEMRAALWEAAGDDLSKIDAVVMSAAVADYRAAAISPTKRKKSGESLSIDLVTNPGLLAEIGAKPRSAKRPILVGFALETAEDAELVAYARKKLAEKKVDLVVANHAKDSLGTEDNRVTLVTAAGAEPLAPAPKHVVADAILDRLR